MFLFPPFPLKSFGDTFFSFLSLVELQSFISTKFWRSTSVKFQWSIFLVCEIFMISMCKFLTIYIFFFEALTICRHKILTIYLFPLWIFDNVQMRNSNDLSIFFAKLQWSASIKFWQSIGAKVQRFVGGFSNNLSLLFHMCEVLTTSKIYHALTTNKL